MTGALLIELSELFTAESFEAEQLGDYDEADRLAAIADELEDRWFEENLKRDE